MRLANRIAQMPAYVHATAAKKMADLRAKGVDVISLGAGDPDLPTPPHIVEALRQAAGDVFYQRYPEYDGLPALREAIAAWYSRRFGVTLDPKREVLPLIGSKEGIVHAALAFVDAGDTVIASDPGYPSYMAGTAIAGGDVYPMQIHAANGYAPDWSTIPPTVAAKSKMVWLAYPNNPTGAVADDTVFANAVNFAKQYDTLIAHDAAYTEVTFDGYVAPSFLATEGAKSVGVEFHSLSKTFNMGGWRIGMVVGNPVAVEAIGRMKTQIDTGIFRAVQAAAIAAFNGPMDWLPERNAIYQRRRNLLVAALQASGMNTPLPKGGLFVWGQVPAGQTSAGFCNALLERTGVWLVPGDAFGPNGEGYFRASITIADEKLTEAADRIGKLTW